MTIGMSRPSSRTGRRYQSMQKRRFSTIMSPVSKPSWKDCVLSMPSAPNGDKLYGDTAIALLFGRCPAGTLRGLPLQAYLESAHDDDRRDLANAISEAVRSGRPYHAEYRVRNLW